MMTEDKSQLVSLGLQLAEMVKEVQKAQDLLKEVVEEYGMSSDPQRSLSPLFQIRRGILGTPGTHSYWKIKTAVFFHSGFYKTILLTAARNSGNTSCNGHPLIKNCTVQLCLRLDFT